MKLELETGFDSKRIAERPKWGRTPINYHDGTRDTVYWVIVFGAYVELTITRGEA